MSISRTVLILSLAAFLMSVAPAQHTGGGGEANPALVTNKTSLKKWQNMRFGMFIHWGPVTLRGTEIGWSRGPQVRIDDYDGLYKEFNPVLFNAKAWVGAAKAAGMKYLVITSKHHDGFCLWDSKYTTYDIASTPFRRDVLRELADECKRQGIMFCTYYSVLDWHHPDYTTRYGGDPRPISGSHMDTYRTYLRNQVTELIRKYDTNMLWFDGQWEDSWTHEDGMDLYAYARSLKDALLINNRVDKGHRSSLKGMSASEVYAGDFGTPEQEVGAFDNERPWESCITICNQWSWKPNDRIKSLRECIQTLAKTAGGGGNLLLNVSPMPDGRLEQRQIDRLNGMGAWLKRNGESIYGTTGGPLKATSWMVSTNKGNRIFVHLLTPPKDELMLPAIPGRIVIQARVLDGPKLAVRTGTDRIMITLPQTALDSNDAVLALDLDGPAAGVPLLEVPANVFMDAQIGEATLKTPPSAAYAAHGVRSLTDGVRGSVEQYDGEWLGFEQDDCEAVLDLQSSRQITSAAVGCMQAQGSWIFLPRNVEVSVSSNGTDYTVAGSMKIGEPQNDGTVTTRDLAVSFSPVIARFVRVRAENVGLCPAWHKGAGGKAWVFVDEITVR